MKIDKVGLILGLSITLVFAWFSWSYFNYIEIPSLQRPYRPFTDAFEIVDLRFNDIKYKFKTHQQSQAPVALVTIDDESVREIGRWPWSRELMAELTEKIIKLGAKSVAFDVIFSEPEKGNEQADAKFADVVTKNPNQIILGTFSESKFNILPYQDICVAEAFLKTSGDQIVKINPGFSLDDLTNPLDDLNWGTLFTVFFQNIQTEETSQVLKYLERTKIEDLTPFQKNFLNARLSQSLYNYCKTWLNKDDIFLDPTVAKNVEPLYLQLIQGSPQLKNLTFSEFVKKIRTSYTNHPIPEYGEWTPNIPAIQTPATYTASFIAEPDPDGYVRRYPLFYRSGNKLGSSFIPSLALQSFLLSGPYRAELKMATRKSGNKYLQEFSIYDTSKEPEKKISSYPVDGAGQMLINFYGRQVSLPYVPAKDIFNDRPTLRVLQSVQNKGSKNLKIDQQIINKADFFKGRSVLVGATAIGIYDLRNTPVDATYPGPEIHLTMLANLIENNFLQSWKLQTQALPWIILVVGSLLSIAMAWIGSIASFGLLVGLLGMLLGMDFYLFLKQQIMVNSFLLYFSIFTTFFIIQLYKYFGEEKKKRELKSTFSKYVSPAVVDELLKDTKNLKLGGKKERITVFFSDVRGFTTISEKLSPEELSRVLNLYLTPMTEIVFANKGTLDKYMGDAVMAFFGAPVKYPDHAKMACRCALKSIEKLYDLQKVFAKQGLPIIDIGIGINTGEMSVGNMGSNIVQNYTVMGDSVNLGSRLEGINKEYGTRIIISEFTYEDVKGSFTAREIDRVRVKGKNEPVRIYELICEGPASGEKATLLELFNRAYQLYLEKNFSEALIIFKEALATSTVKEDPVSKLFIERCEDSIETPPPQNWDGVYVMKTK